MEITLRESGDGGQRSHAGGSHRRAGGNEAVRDRILRRQARAVGRHCKNTSRRRRKPLKPPSVLFPRELYFDDGEHRVELIHLGIAHTHGDAVAWLPKERILFTGDACVNGPYNFVGDGNVEKWITTLAAAKALNAEAICPGHGPRGPASVVEDQQLFFRQLREQVGALVQAKKSAPEILEVVPHIGEELKSRPQINRYVSDGLAAQVEKVFKEMTGRAFRTSARPHRRQGACTGTLMLCRVREPLAPGRPRRLTV